jgi:hypothetical protein
MTFVKDLTKFMNSKQCKMIGCIFLVLLVSILIKLSMPDTFEHLDYTFKLKFSKVPSPDEPKITDFDFSIDGKSSEPITEKNPITEIEFDIEQPSGDIDLVISGNTATAKAVMDKLKIAGKESTSNNGTDYTFSLNNDEYTSGDGISMTDQ